MSIIVKREITVDLEIEKVDDQITLRIETPEGVKTSIVMSEGQATAIANGIDDVLHAETKTVCGQCGHVLYSITDRRGGILEGAYLCPVCSVGVKGQ